jgi:outer membrane protein assembly factor BamB
MKTLSILVAITTAFGQPPVTPPPEAPLKLVETIPLPVSIKGQFDHFGVDVLHKRLFVAAERSGSVLVLDSETGRLIQTITGFGIPHAILYREDLERLFVTDGNGALKTFDGASYRPSGTIKLLADADSIGYDTSTKLLYIVNGGKDVHQANSMLSVVDTEANQKLADLTISGETLEAMALDAYRPRLYINNRSGNQIDVLDRWRRTLVATWPLTLAKDNVAMALDEPHQRLFVGCRTGKLIVLDTNTGQELQSLSIVNGVDDVTYDAATRRLYASGDGAVSVYSQTDADHYQSLGNIPTGPSARNSRLVPEINRYFVSVPARDSEPAKVLVFEPLGLPAMKPPSHDLPAYTVHAPKAEALVRDTLSSHPFLRKMGLHAVAPGQSVSVIIANGNATRIGIPTTQGDFEAVASGATYCKKTDSYYNLKLPMFDAANRRIGILVMEIPVTAASDDADAIKIAEDLRRHLSQSIPDLSYLFS